MEFHCLRHERHTEISRERAEADTDSGLSALGELGVEARRWRPPWGALATWTGDLARSRSLELTGWTLDTEDWAGLSAEQMLEAARPGLEHEPVVLMHDGLGPGARREGCAETADLVAPLVRELRAAGSEPAPLGDRTRAGAMAQMSPRPDDAFGVQDALAAVAAGAAELDAHPQFPVAAFDALRDRRAHRAERARSRRCAHRVPRGRVGRRARRGPRRRLGGPHLRRAPERRGAAFSGRARPAARARAGRGGRRRAAARAVGGRPGTGRGTPGAPGVTRAHRRGGVRREDLLLGRGRRAAGAGARARARSRARRCWPTWTSPAAWRSIASGTAPPG